MNIFLILKRGKVDNTMPIAESKNTVIVGSISRYPKKSNPEKLARVRKDHIIPTFLAIFFGFPISRSTLSCKE